MSDKLQAGVSHCFVNLGSDHPSIMEAMVKGQQERPDEMPRIITCPNEMVALSMADGYARATNQPQAVIVHVDVGTSGMGAALHNASAGKAPVLIFAGLSPCTLEGEYTGSRTEYIHWLQDVPDQKQIVAQYCRYTAEIKRGRNVKQLVNRALAWAMSEPRGPTYLYGTRETMEELIEPYSLNQACWTLIENGALRSSQVSMIAETLVKSSQPLVVTGYGARNHALVGALTDLADTIRGLRVLDTAGSDMCFPASHPGWLGTRLGIHPAIETADTILVIDCDVPWINTQCKPNNQARIFHLDSDPLKSTIPLFYIDAVARFRVDATTAVSQVAEYIKSHFATEVSSVVFAERWNTLQLQHAMHLQQIATEAEASQDGLISCPYLINEVRKACPTDTIWVVEAVTNTHIVADQIQATLPGSWLNCGGGGLGWSGGGALGVKLATDKAAGGNNKGRFVCQIVADGTFMFSVPSSVYWIAQKYDIPVLTIVLNNHGK